MRSISCLRFLYAPPLQTRIALVKRKGGGGTLKYPKQVTCSPAWTPPPAAQLFVFSSPKLGMLVRQIRIVLLLPLLLLAPVSVLAQAPRLTLSVDQGVPSGEIRLLPTDTKRSLANEIEEGLAVSPDGRWLLASGGGSITVWKIDSVRGIVTQTDAQTNAGLGGRGLAVSRDSSLVFASGRAIINSTISVWRLDAADGSLEEAARYTEGGIDDAANTVRGLRSVWDVVLSPDDRLLFVTSRGGSGAEGALSVWRVNPSGTLVQTDVHISAGASDTEGLNQAAGAAVTPDGRLLFVGSLHGSSSLDNSTLGIWRVNAEASTVSFVRTLSDRRRLQRPLAVTLGPSGDFLFVSSRVNADAETDPLSVYEVKAAEEDLAGLASYREDILGPPIGLAATREVLAVAEFERSSVALWQRNTSGTLRFASRHDSSSPIGLAASPAGGLVFSKSGLGRAGIGVWQVQGIPRVPAGQEVRVMVNAEATLGSALTVTVQARQGSRVRTAAATLIPSETQAEAVFSGSALGQGEWIFSASVPADMENIANASAARATLRIGSPLIRLENLSGVILEGADLNIRISTEGNPVLEDAQVTLRATLQEGTQPRTVMGFLRDGQTSVTVTFAGEDALTEGDWVVSAESSILPTDANSALAVTVLLLSPRLTISVDQGVPSGEMRLVKTDANTGLPTGNNEGIAVSPDGRWLLASGGGGITVWKIDSVRGTVTQSSDRMGAGLGGRGLAVSRDSRLVFTSDGASTSTISVWRLNADDGGLEEVAQYTEGGTDPAGNTVRGLASVWDVVLSPDGRLLFVTSRGGNSLGGALSVWGVNPSGTLVQIDVHVSAGASDTEGLNRIAGAAVTPDGRLLFAGSFHSNLDNSTLGIWRVNAEASTVSFVRTLSDRRMLPRPRVVTLGPDGRFLFVSSQVFADSATDPLSVYEVNAAEENLASVASYGEDDGGDDDILGSTIGLAATREVLAVAEIAQGSIALWQKDDDGTLRFASRHDSASPIGLAASPAGGLVFSSSNDGSEGISVWQVLGIPRVPAGQEVRVMVNPELVLGSALTVTVQARQGSRVSTATATLMPSDTQAEAVFSGSALGQGEWIFSASLLTDTANMVDVLTARATLRIGGPFVRLENLSGVIRGGTDLNIRVSTEGPPVLGDAEVTLQAAQEGARPRTAMGLLREGQTSVTVTFAGENALTGGDWVLSAASASILSTDADSALAVTVIPLPKLTLSVDQGVPSGELRLVRRSANSGSSISFEGFAVSPDGRWLFNAGNNLEVWEIDSARGIVTQRMSSLQSGFSRGLAVSRDSSLVFVPNQQNNQITVFRLNADDGGLEEVAQYTEGGTDAARNTVRGLTNVFDVVPSPDGRLLFVTSVGVSDSAGGALSVWGVNPSGTLVQTDVHVSAGASDTEGLNRAAGAAVTPDGRLLFVGSFHGSSSLDNSTLGIWRVNAEASTVSLVRTLRDDQRLGRPRHIALRPSGRLLFVENFSVGLSRNYLSAYRVNAAGKNLESADPGLSGDPVLAGIAATEEALIASDSDKTQILLLRINENDTVSLVSRQHAGASALGVAASPAGGLVFANSRVGQITVWQVLGIPRVPAGQEVRVMVNAEPAPDSALTMIVQARQGSRVSMAAATLMPPDTHAEAVFSGSALGQGEWIFSASLLTDTGNMVDVPTARATLRISDPLIKLSNLSGITQQGADLNIRVSTERMVPVIRDAEVTLQATQEGVQQQTVTGILLEGQTSVTVTFAGENALTAGDWVLSAKPSRLLSTGANSTLAVTVILPFLRLTLSVDQGVQSGEMRLVQTDAKTGTGNGNEGLAVSPDGRWLLASGGGGITVWKIDSVRGMVTQSSDRMGAGLGGSGLAVSRDSRLVFTSDGASTISVWRLNADNGGLEEVAEYTEGGTDAAEKPIRGLITTHGVVLSPDDRLLFVTSSGVSNNGTLSVWSVNTSGTLVQTGVHVSAGASDIQGLNEIAGAAVTPDGRLLFAGSFHGLDSLDSSTLGIWRVNAEAPVVSFVRTLPDRRMLRRPRVVTLGPDGRFLFVSSQVENDAATDPLSVYRVDAAGENLEPVASYGEGISGDTIGLAATREVLAVAEFGQGSVALWQRNDDGTLRFASRHNSPSAIGVAASPAGGLVFSSSNDGSEGISVWQVLGIPRVPAGEEVRVMVNTEPVPGSALTVIVQARQGSRVSTATATLMPSDTRAEAVFSGSALGRGEWIFSASVPADMADRVDRTALSAARATLRTVPAPAEPTLFLKLPPQPVNPAQPVSIRLQKSAPISEMLTVDITAMRSFGEITFTRTGRVVISPSEMMGTVTFEGIFFAGRWTLTARVTPPGTVSIIPSTATIMVRPPLLSLQRLGLASVAAGTRVTVRVAAEAMPEDEGLGVRVIARQAMRADIERSAVLGSGPDFSADVEFTSLPPGEWLLTAEAERPDTFRTEGATDTVTVEPAVLTLTPVSERVPAGESVRLILGSVVPLGVAVNVNVAAEPVSPSFLQQMTAVNLDAASTSTTVVYDPGELAPGIWNFSVQVTDAAVRMVADVSMATATLRIAAPLIRLSNLSGAIPEGADLNIRVRTEGMVPVAGAAEVTLRATLQEGTQQRTVTGRLLEGQTSVTVSFVDETALTEGEWTVSAETASTLLQTDANLSSLTVIVGPPPQLLLELTGGSDIVDSDGMITLILRLMPALPAAVTVTVTVTDEDNNTISEQQVEVALSSSLQLTFSASDLGTGRLRFTARGPAGVLKDSGAEVTVQVRAMSTVELTLGAPTSVTVGGAFTVAVGVSGEMPIPAEVMVTVSFDGAQRTAALTDTVPTTSVSFVAPAASGDFSLMLSGSVEVTDALRVTVQGVSTPISVVPVQLTLSLEGPESVQVGEDFSVIVGTGDDAVPAGTTVLVTVSDGTTDTEAVLTARISTASVSFTAPIRAGEVSVTATGVPQTSSGSLEVAVPDASSLAVTVFSVDVRLSLSEVPEDPVAAGSTFTITVGASDVTPVPAGTTVTVTVSFGNAVVGVVSLTREMNERSVIVDVSADLAGMSLRLSVEGVATGTPSVTVIGAGRDLEVDAFPVVLNLDVPDTAAAPVFRGVMFPVRVSADDLPPSSTLRVTVSLTLEEASIATQSVSLTADNSSAVVMFEAPVAAAAVTTYTVTTDDSEMMGAAVLAVTEAESAIVFVTRVNADLSGDGTFDEDDVILMIRVLLTENLAAKSEGFDLAGLSPIPDEQRNELQSRFNAFADVADISGNGRLDTVDAVFLLRNLNATANDLRNRVDNPFDYLCGSASQNACMGIESPHANITGAEGIRYEIIGEQLEALRNVPQPPVLPPRTP